MRCRCPHCQNAIEIIGEETVNDLVCPSCGSTFNLLANSGELTLPHEHRRIAHFELLDQVGVGAFGAVWKARDTKLDRLVAVKLPRQASLSEEDTEKFFREARAAAQVSHPNIVSIHEVGRDGDVIYMSSDYIEGATLSEWLHHRQLDARQAARLCVTICNALHEAHEAGVVHRDLKPTNVLMDLNDQPHIADFGLAKRDAGEFTMTMDGQILGTPAYMSPEQAKGDAHKADRRSDIYSMGVILYELLTGELPFRGDTRMLIVQILKDDPTPPRKLSSKLPKDIETICLKCLNKDAAKRYQTGKELSEDLSRFINGESILASPPGPIQRSWKWIRKNQTPLMRFAAVLSIVIAAGSVAITIYFNVKRNEALVVAKEATIQRYEAVTKREAASIAQRHAESERQQALMAEAEANMSREDALRSAANAKELAVIAKEQREELLRCLKDFQLELGMEHPTVQAVEKRLAALGIEVE